MEQALSIAEAKAHFADVIRDAEGGRPVVVTRYGAPVAVVVNIADYEELRRSRAASAVGGLASLAGGWKGSEDLAKDLEVLQQGRRPPRPLPRSK